MMMMVVVVQQQGVEESNSITHPRTTAEPLVLCASTTTALSPGSHCAPLSACDYQRRLEDPILRIGRPNKCTFIIHTITPHHTTL